MPKTTNPLVKQSGGQSINIILTVVVLVVAVAVIGGVLLFSGTSKNSNPNPNGAAVPADVLRKPDSNVLGQAPDNKVTLVEFYDFQCPACAQYYPITKQIEQEYQGRITYVTRNFPLDMHPLAPQAAKAAEAAGLQGKYSQMFHGLYDNWKSWAASPDGQQVSSDPQKASAQFDQIAQRAGVDVARMHQDMNSPQVNAKIEKDKADGNAAGVNSTPTFYINGKQFQPPQDAKTLQDVVNAFKAQIDKELGQK